MSGQPAAPEHPFLARRPYVRPSLNQARIVDLPGVALPDDVRGRLGYELLGAAGLAARLRRQFPALRNAAQPLRAFDAYLAPGHPRQAAALAEAARYGRALGYLLLMLKRGDAVNRVVRRDWGPAHWAFWRGIRCVVVGGGLVAGRLGETAVAAADALLQTTGMDLRVRRAARPAQLPLLGAARTAPADAAAMLVFDFGQSRLKAGVAFYGAGGVCGLRLLPPRPAACGALGLAADAALAEETAVALVDAMAAAWCAARDAGWPVCRRLAAAIACYLVDGHPALPEDMGCYGRLQLLTADLPAYLAARVRERLGAAVDVALYHDGMAAALAYAGEGETAVITLGTAIGNGFPPPAAGLHALSEMNHG